MTTTDATFDPTPSVGASQDSSETLAFRALRLVALAETVSFAVLLVCSVLKRTTDLNLVPVLGPVHGGLFVALVVLALGQRTRLRWSWLRTVVALTVGSPFAHFFVRATRLSG